MKNIIVFVFMFSTSVVALPKSPTPVPYVDLNLYMKDWYEIAHVPLFFESNICACSRQSVSARTDGKLNMWLTCNKDNPGGVLKEIRGIATNDDPKSNAKYTLDVNMAIKPTYWIVGLDPYYRYVVVSDSSGTALYILSNKPTLEKNLYDEAVAIADDQNLSTSLLEVTDQKGCLYP